MKNVTLKYWGIVAIILIVFTVVWNVTSERRDIAAANRDYARAQLVDELSDSFGQNLNSVTVTVAAFIGLCAPWGIVIFLFIFIWQQIKQNNSKEKQPL